MTSLLLILSAVLSTLPALFFRLFHPEASPWIEAFVFGAGILGAAFLLSWAAEVAQMDMSQGLALAILALIAILPEYAVDLYFAWVAASQPEYAAYATANMTGANRLLVGAGWPFIVLLWYLRCKKRHVELTRHNRVEISYLLLATCYAFLIPLKGGLSLIDCFFLVGIFGAYAWRTALMETEEPELAGPALIIGSWSPWRRRIANFLLFGFAGLVIFLSAEPFAESLIETGKVLGVDEFYLVQWLAPLASEAPEFTIAAIWTVRGNAVAAIGALISSKVNQWTLLVGTIPLVYSIALGRPGEMPLDLRQVHEILLTAAQSVFASLVLLNLRIDLLESAALFALFVVQMLFPDIRVEVTYLYLGLSIILLFIRRAYLKPTIRKGILRMD